MSKIEQDISAMLPTEEGFVLSAWKKSSRHQPQNAGLPSGAFFERANRDVSALLDRSGLRILVSRDATDPKFALGFIVFETTGTTLDEALCVHWLYTRHGFRRLGVAAALLRKVVDLCVDPDLFFTHSTRFDDLAEQMGFEFVSLGKWLRGSK